MRHYRTRSAPAVTLLALLGVAAPLVFLAWRRGGVDPNDQALAFGGVLCLTALWCGFGERFGAPVSIPWPAAVLPLFPLVQLIPLEPERWGLLSAFRSQLSHELSQLGLAAFPAISVYPLATLQRAFVLAGCCAVFVLARATSRQAKAAAWAAALPLLALGLVEAVLGIRQYLYGQLFGDMATPAAHGTFVNCDHFAALLEACFGLSIGWALGTGFFGSRAAGNRFGNVPLGWALSLAAGAYLLGVIFSFSRMGIVVLVVTSVAALGWLRPQDRLSRILVPVLLLGAVAAAGWIGVDGLPQRFQQLVSGRGDPARLALWSDSLRVAHDHLWTGAGLGAFPYAFQRSAMYLPRKTIDHAHSDYLELLVELGLPATLFLMTVVGVAFLRAARSAGRLRDGRRRALVAGALLGAAALALHAGVDFPLQMPALAAAFAALLGWASGLAAPRHAAASPLGRWLGFAAFGFAAAGAHVALAAAPPWDAEHSFSSAQQALLRGETATAQTLLDQAARANPFAATIWLKRAELAEMQGDETAALRFASFANRLEPFTFRTTWLLAHVELRQGHVETAAGRLAAIAGVLPEFRPAVFHAAWSGGIPPKMLAEVVVPPEGAALGDYLRFLAARRAWPQIVPAYRALAAKASPEVPASALRYTFDKLFEAGQGASMKALWEQVATSPQSAATPWLWPQQPGSTTILAVLDGEAGGRLAPAASLAPGHAGWSWATDHAPWISPHDGAEGEHCLEMDLDRPETLEGLLFPHYLAVEPGKRYQLEAEVRAQGVAGMRVRVRSHRRDLARSSRARQSAQWSAIRLTLRPASSEEVLRLTVAGPLARGFPRRRKGTFCLRNVRLVETP